MKNYSWTWIPICPCETWYSIPCCNAILRGDLKPGERLMEMHLANKLGVSRTPIREAIRMLEQEGLAVTIPRKGAQVAKMTEKDLQDVLEIRDALDELAVSMACQRMTLELLLELKESMKDFEIATRSGDVRKIVEADEAFHNVIYRMADNPKLETIVNNMREQTYRYRYEYVKGNSTYNQLIDEHAKIIAGLRKRTASMSRRSCIRIWKIRSRLCAWLSVSRNKFQIIRPY